jgi:hypothetical protein
MAKAEATMEEVGLTSASDVAGEEVAMVAGQKK